MDIKMVAHEVTSFKHNSPCRRVATMCRFRLIIIVLIVIGLGPLFVHYYLSKLPGDVSKSQSHQKGIQLDDLNLLKVTDLKVRIEEMTRIKGSVSSELRLLESRRQKLQGEITLLTQKVEQLKTEYSRYQIDLERLQLSVQQVQYAQKEVIEKYIPQITAPKRILPSLHDDHFVKSPNLNGASQCRMHLCFDYSRCSLTSGFPVYFYHPDDHRLSWNQLEKFVKTAVTEALNMNVHITFDPTVACIYVVLIGEIQDSKFSRLHLESYLQRLGHWNGDGRNHVLLNLARSMNATDIFAGVNTGRAMIVQSHFSPFQFRNGFDMIVPPLIGQPYGDVWEGQLALSPARRKFLLSYQGEYRTGTKFKNVVHRKLLTHNHTYTYSMQENSVHIRSQLSKNFVQDEDDFGDDKISEEYVVESLKHIQMNAAEDKILFKFSCGGRKIECIDSEWCMCDGETERQELISQSTFVLVITSSTFNLPSTSQFQARLFEALKLGAIPVVLGNEVILPYQEVLDWQRAIVNLPKARVTELHFFLRTFTDPDIVHMRRQGRLLWERYMSTTQQIINTVLAVVRQRIQIPPPPAQEEPSPNIFNATFQPVFVEVAAVQDNEGEENLGPIEPLLPSVQYQRNFTYSVAQKYHVWNEAIDPFTLYPYTPFDPILPAESKFIGSSFGFRPIGQGAGGAGKEFSESLGGNVPREQFTVVMLTFEREAVLIDSLQRLRGLPFLNKVIVVWNGVQMPSPDLRWPKIGVPIQVIKARRNSLNNRFLPFDSIETEAVLSMDDDAHLRHDEIAFSFRVWRESRDRIVGLPGRYHAWDLQYGGWLYNSNYSCELSMVLTGAAFFHKYYSYLYSYWMPQAIREKVDEYMNCEDIAMNFLVSHITRKPPIKVTSRWTFRCPGCPVALSEEDSHFHERHKCLNFFSQVYGYMPLLNTQFRADSVLFKTRIPHDKQKCFKFI